MSFVSQQTWLLRLIAQEMLGLVQKQPHSRAAQRLARLLLGRGFAPSVVRLCVWVLFSA